MGKSAIYPYDLEDVGYAINRMYTACGFTQDTPEHMDPFERVTQHIYDMRAEIKFLARRLEDEKKEVAWLKKENARLNELIS